MTKGWKPDTVGSPSRKGNQSPVYKTEGAEGGLDFKCPAYKTEGAEGGLVNRMARRKKPETVGSPSRTGNQSSVYKTEGAEGGLDFQSPVYKMEGAEGGLEIDEGATLTVGATGVTEEEDVSSEYNFSLRQTDQSHLPQLHAQPQDCTGKMVPSTKPSFRPLHNRDKAMCVSGQALDDSSQEEDVDPKATYAQEVMDFQELHRKHHRERWQTPGKDCGPFHHCHVQRLDAKKEDKAQKMYSPTVGKVTCMGTFLGSATCCFRRKNRCWCITCYHVIKDALRLSKHGYEDEVIQELKVQFLAEIFSVRKLNCPDIGKDFIVFELEPNPSYDFPPAVEKIGPRPKGQDRNIFIAGFQLQEKELHWDFEGVLLNYGLKEKFQMLISWYKVYWPSEKITNFTHVPDYNFVISTGLIPGSSGGLVVAEDDHGEFVAIGMVLKGYPGPYYKLSIEEKRKVKGCYLFEVALAFEGIDFESFSRE